MAKRYAWIVISLCFALLAGCRKNVDESPPSIVIQSPAAGSWHQVLETVDVIATAQDEEGIEWVKVDIVTASNVIHGSTSNQFFDGQQQASVNAGVLLDNIHTPTGTYYVRVRAYDGTNEHVAYREIQLAEVPREVEDVFVFSMSAQNQVDIHRLEDGSALWIATIGTDFSKAATNSYNGEVALCGDIVSGTMFLNPPQLEITATNATINNQNASYYHDFFYAENDRLYYAVTRDNRVEIYSTGGNLNQILNTQQNKVPYHLATDGNLLLAEERSFNGDNVFLGQYYRGSGTFQLSVSIPYPLVAMHIGTSGIDLFGKDGTSYRYATYHPDDQSLTSWTELSVTGNVEEIIPAGLTADEGQRYAITTSTETRVVKADNGSLANLTLFPVAGKALAYDEVNNELWVLGSGEVTQFQIDNATPVETISVPSGSLDIEVLYNK
ncbi:MAG: hypothetical protein KDC12_06435 [Flavobacteriales bacterium]|nr:hypothetical protein [Flavobacteriales bacterium]